MAARRPSRCRSSCARRELKILTNSYPLAEFLIHETQNRVALPGGEVYRDQKLIVAPFDDDAIQHYSARLMFMSAISIGPLGVIEGDALIAGAEMKLLKRAEKLIVLADASKFVARGSLVVCPLSRVHALITEFRRVAGSARHAGRRGRADDRRRSRNAFDGGGMSACRAARSRGEDCRQDYSAAAAAPNASKDGSRLVFAPAPSGPSECLCQSA